MKVTLLWIFLGFVANALWGATFPSSKYLVDYFSPMTITALRFSLASVFLGFYIILKRKPLFDLKLIKNPQIWGLSFVMYFLLYIVQIKGLEFISSSFSSILMLTTPAFVWIINTVLEKRVDKRGLVFTLSSMLISWYLILQYKNVTLLSSVDGILLTLLASALLALSLTLTKNILAPTNNLFSIESFTFHTMLMGSLMCLPWTAWTINAEQLELLFSPYIFGNFFFLSLFCSVFAFLFWNVSVKKLGATTSGILMTIKTPAAIIISCIYLDEFISLEIIIATFCLLLLILANELNLLKSFGGKNGT